ncbi:heterokaryon incompatibility protein-domain-containing protein [Xylaria palmicola]|nr:heterokaryon incompatibility protein-domain-containing protein [Xylaria palmicola]
MYTYRPLSAPNDFRLLELLPGQGDEEIHCTLTHESLTRHRPYFAVSYTWGSPELVGEVKLDATGVVPVRDNLYQLLRHLRRPHSSLVLWTDALCIDQSSIPEKNIQVPLMGRIYSSAESVFVWLGLHADGSGRHPDSPPCTRDGPQSSPALQMSATTPMAADPMTGAWAADLRSRPYWSRTWIVQEIVLATNLTLFCGDRSCTWPSFTLDALKNDPGTRYDATGPDYAFVNTVALRDTGTETELRRLLFKFHMTYCFDPRDLVYSLLNFASDTRGRAHGIAVDYACTIAALFVQTLAFCSGLSCRAFVSGRLAIECLRFCDTLATRLGAELEPSLEYAEDMLRTLSSPVLVARLTCRSYFVNVKRFARIISEPARAGEGGGSEMKDKPSTAEMKNSRQPLTKYHARSIPAKEPLILWTSSPSLEPADVVYAVDYDSPNEPSHQLCCVCRPTHYDTDEDGVKQYRYNIAGLGIVSNTSSDGHDSAQHDQTREICAFLDRRLRSLEGREVSDSLPDYIMELTLQELVGVCQVGRTTGAYLPWTLSTASTVHHWQEQDRYKDYDL